jgi:YD repeat-containing protein
MTHYTYDDAGQVLTEIDNWVSGYTGSESTVNLTTTDTYDTAGRQITTTNPAGSLTRTVYDTSGNVCRTIADASVDPTTLTHPCTDALPAGSETSSANIDTRYAYSDSGQKTSMTAPSPADGATPTHTVTTDYAYDTAGHLCRVLENATIDLSTLSTDPCTDSLGVTPTTSQNVETRYTYDANGNMASGYTAGDSADGDPAGTTGYGYDDLGRLTSQTDPDGKVTSFTYDTTGDKTSQTDPDGNRIYYFYDTAGRLCQRAALPSGVTYTAPSNPCTSSRIGRHDRHPVRLRPRRQPEDRHRRPIRRDDHRRIRCRRSADKRHRHQERRLPQHRHHLRVWLARQDRGLLGHPDANRPVGHLRVRSGRFGSSDHDERHHNGRSSERQPLWLDIRAIGCGGDRYRPDRG